MSSVLNSVPGTALNAACRACRLGSSWATAFALLKQGIGAPSTLAGSPLIEHDSVSFKYQ